MKTTRNQIENLLAEICKKTGMKNNCNDAIKAGKDEYISYSGSGGLYTLHMVNVYNRSVTRAFQTPYTKIVFTIGELHAHLTGILAGVNAFLEVYKNFETSY